MSKLLISLVNIDAKSLLAIGAVFAIIAYVVSTRNEKLKGIPVVTDCGGDHERAMMEGALKYPNTPFVVGTQRPFMIVPPCCYEELRNISQTKATFWEIQKKEMGAEFTGIFQHNAEVDKALRFDLNRNLANTLIQVEDKIDWVLEKELGRSEDWKAFRVHQSVVRIVARLVSGVFVAPHFTRDDEWTNLSLGLAVGVVLIRDAIKAWPTLMQPFVGPFLPEIRTANRQISRMAEMLKPVISSTVSGSSATTKPLFDGENLDPEATDEAPEKYFMSSILKRLNTTDAEVLARAQVSLSFASLNTTTNALCFIVLDLAARPEYTQPLRDEIEEVVKQDQVEEDESGILRFTQSSLSKLWKMDSFMKESSRLSKNPITNLRMVMEPITLSTGHRLPKGTRIAFGARAVQLSPQSETYSPDYNPPETKAPHEFDGYRYYRLRKMAGKENKHLFVTVSPESLTWGYGNHACPGRFFADSEIKVILIELLRKWDFRVADPAKTNSESLRKMRGLFLVAPKDAEIELKRRKM